MAGEANRQSVRRGVLLVISSPSGAGKTTLSRNLLEAEKNIAMSVSVTTRPRRHSEIEGSHYFFKSVPEFTFMRDSGQLLEWAEVHGNFYGTSRVWIESQMQAGCDMLLEIDWQGAQQVRRLFPAATTIFILPPSTVELERRLRARGQDAEDVIQRRVAAALGEMRHVDEFDFVIINKDLQTASEDLAAVVRAARLRLTSQRAVLPEMFRFLEQ